MKLIPVTSSPMVGIPAGATAIVSAPEDSGVYKLMIGMVISSTSIGILEFSANWMKVEYSKYTSDTYLVSWLLDQGYKILVLQ